jgi:hypothetical protein
VNVTTRLLRQLGHSELRLPKLRGPAPATDEVYGRRTTFPYSAYRVIREAAERKLIIGVVMEDGSSAAAILVLIRSCYSGSPARRRHLAKCSRSLALAKSALVTRPPIVTSG